MIKNLTTGLVVGLVVLLLAGGAAYKNTLNQKSKDSTPPPSVQSTGTENNKTFSLEDIAKHSGSESCWTTINGNVYDLTNWISKHPGGEQAILGLCGKDGSSAFNEQHGGQKKQVAVLATFLIGKLK